MTTLAQDDLAFAPGILRELTQANDACLGVYGTIVGEGTIAVGDDVNDLPMIRNAGLGVAMGNARPEVKAVANRVMGANTDEVLAAFLDELIDHHLVEPQPIERLRTE